MYKVQKCLEINEQFCLTRAQMCIGKEGEKNGQIVLGQLWRMQNGLLLLMGVFEEY